MEWDFNFDKSWIVHILILLMSGSAIDYEVEEKNKFAVDGSLDKLYQKNTDGFFVWGVETTF